MKRLRMMLLAVLLLFAACTGCAETYQKEENTGRDKDTHPWLIRTPSAVWHLAKSDIELLGEEAYFEGLYKALENKDSFQMTGITDAVREILETTGFDLFLH